VTGGYHSRRVPPDYLDRVLPKLEDLFPPAGGVPPPRAGGEYLGRRKVHFYIDQEDYELLSEVVARLTRMQEPIGDPRGLTSKVLRLSVKIGLREIVARMGRGGEG